MAKRHFFSDLLARSGPLSRTLVAVCVAIFLLSGFGTDRELLYYFWFYPPLIVEGELWRLISPVFIHFMIAGLPLHLLFNMMWLWDLGGAIENHTSWRYLAALVLITGVISNLLQYLLAGPAFGGMSGVVYGLLGFLWTRARFDPFFPVRLNQGVVNFMLIWLALGFVMFSWVANYAHLGGLLAGAGLGFVTAKTRRF